MIATRSRSSRALGALLSLVLGLILLAAPATAFTQEASPVADDAVERAAAWLLAQQAPDGGFVGFAGSSDVGVTVDAVIALAAARNAGITVDLAPALAFLEENALVYAQTGPGQAAKLALGVAAAGGDPHDVNGVLPLTIVEVSASRGMVGFSIFEHVYGVLALVASDRPVPATALDVLREAQLDDGSWSFDGTKEAGAGDTNTTALVIQALVAAGQGDDPMVAAALQYLASVQADSGGFPYQPGESVEADANSTALAVQAIIAVGQDPASDAWRNAAGALARFQNPSGAFRYADDQPDDNLFATVQALPAIAGQPFPILPAVPAASDGPDVTEQAA